MLFCKESFLKRLHAYLQTQIAVSRLAISDIPLVSRQFLGMINDIIVWSRSLITALEISESDIKDMVTDAVETFPVCYLTSR